MREGESGKSSGNTAESETGSISQQHWNTPFAQAKDQQFDSYLLVGKKGDQTVVYGSEDFKKSTDFIEGLGYLRPEGSAS